MAKGEIYQRALGKLVAVIVNAPKTALALCGVAVVALGLQVADLETNPTTYVLQKSHPVRVTDAELSDVFTATGATISVMITASEREIFEPSTLQLINQLTEQFEDINLSNDADHTALQQLAKDEVSAELIQQMLQDGLQPQDLTALEQLAAHLAANALSSDKERAFLRDLAVFINPIAKVRSLTNVEDIRDENDDLVIQELVPDVLAEPETLAALAESVRQNPLLMNSVLAGDLSATIIRIELTVPNDYTAPVVRAYQKVQAITAQIPAQYQVNTGGSAVVFNEMSHIIKRDNGRFLPVILLVIVVVLALCFRSVEGVYIPILVAVASLVCTFGVMALVGFQRNMISSLTPIFVMASAVADAIHILNHYYRNLREGELAAQQAITASITTLFKPIFLTTITTVCGFLSLAFTEVVFIREFGLMVATGIAFAFLFSIVMVPALVTLKQSPATNRLGDGRDSSWLLRGIRRAVSAANTVWQTHPRGIVTAMVTVFAAATFFAINVKVDYETISFYPEQSQLRSDDQAIKDKFHGVVPLTIRLHGAAAGTFYRSDVVAYIDRLETVLESDPAVGFVVSPNSYLKRLAQVLGIVAERDTLPTDLNQALAAQLLLLYDNSSGAEIRDVADHSYRDGRVIALLTTDRSSVVRAVVQQALAVPVPDGLEVAIAGHAAVVLGATDEIIYGQFNSLIITAGVVLVIMALLFRKFGLGMVAVIPLVLTILINFGIMGALNLDLNIATVIIAALVFGIGIDYSIHLIEAAKLNYRQGLDKTAALAVAVRTTAEPIAINSVTLAAGFLVMTVSQLKPLYYLGNLISATMIISALLTIILVPTLLNLLPISLAESSGDAATVSA